MSRPPADIIELVTDETDALVLGNADILRRLAEYINHLAANDFPWLVQLLYRLDVPEKSVKENIHLHAQEDTGRIIAEMIIRRQLQKIALREKNQQQQDISEEEKW